MPSFILYMYRTWDFIVSGFFLSVYWVYLYCLKELYNQHNISQTPSLKIDIDKGKLFIPERFWETGKNGRKPRKINR